MQDTIPENTNIELAPAISPEAQTEQKLADEIAELWAIDVEAQTTVKKTKAELKAIRQRLGERLYEMKQLLARPGRNGQWSAWLKQQEISRATAYRLVRRFEANPPGCESPHESIPEPTEADIGKLCKAVWSRIQRVLTTPESILVFLGGIAAASGLRHEWRAEGLLVFNPVPKAADELSGSASAPDPASLPSDEAGVNTEMPAAETATATPAQTEAVAGAGDGNSGEVIQ